MTGPPFGEELRRLRQERGISLVKFAGLINYDAGYLSKIETGRKPPSEALVRRCDEVFDTPGELLAIWQQIRQKTTTPPRRRRAELTNLTGSAAVTDSTPSTARPWTTALPTGSVRGPVSCEEAAVWVAHVHRCYQATQYQEAAQLLPVLIESLTALIEEGPAAHRRDALTLLSSAHAAAAKLATKTGDATPAHTAASQAWRAAAEADDPIRQAAATYQLVCAALKAGHHDQAEQLAVDTAESLRGAGPADTTWRGSLTLISALIAARRADHTETHRRLTHAHQLAETIGDGNIGWAAFGPTNVHIHRMSAAAALNDPHATLTAAEQVNLTALPDGLRGRRAQYHLDAAWAHTTLGNDPYALIHLLDTERIAPELLPLSRTSHDVVRRLLGRERRMQVPALRGLADRIGVQG